MNKASSKNWALISIHTLVGVTAVGGGLALMVDPEMMPLDWLDKTFFQNYFLPGIILFGVVGSSAIIAALTSIMKLNGRFTASIISTVFLLFWLMAEVAIIGEIHFLQLVYLALGLFSLILVFYLSRQDA